MTPLDSLTARAARWSAAHRRTAILGWLAFVIAAFAIGNVAGLRLMKQDEFAIGDSRAAERVLAQEFPTQRAGEEVLIQSRNGPLARAQLQSVVNDLVVRLSHTPSVAAIKSPLEKENRGQLSKDGRSALLTFQIAFGHPRHRGRPRSSRHSRRPPPSSARIGRC